MSLEIVEVVEKRRRKFNRNNSTAVTFPEFIRLFPEELIRATREIGPLIFTKLLRRKILREKR